MRSGACFEREVRDKSLDTTRAQKAILRSDRGGPRARCFVEGNGLDLKVCTPILGGKHQLLKSWLELVAVLKVKTMSFLVVCKMESQLQANGLGKKCLRLELRGRAGVHG